MAKQKQTDDQPNKYDKIFRENIEAALPGIVERVLGLHIVSSEELPDDIQHTKERRPDVLKKVTDDAGRTYVLHIEFQVANEMDMAYRMADYSVMLQWKYRLDVKQYVIFLGRGKSRMPQAIDTENFKFRYNLLALSAINYKTFLKSDKPEEKILAILANFEEDGPVLAIKNIVNDIKAFAEGDFAEDRYFKQLRVLVQIRNLEEQFSDAMETISKYFKEEKDPFYKRGQVKGRLEGIEENTIQTAIKMKENGLDINLIANITGLSIEEIEKL